MFILHYLGNRSTQKIFIILSIWQHYRMSLELKYQVKAKTKQTITPLQLHVISMAISSAMLLSVLKFDLKRKINVTMRQKQYSAKLPLTAVFSPPFS